MCVCCAHLTHLFPARLSCTGDKGVHDLNPRQEVREVCTNSQAWHAQREQASLGCIVRSTADRVSRTKLNQEVKSRIKLKQELPVQLHLIRDAPQHFIPDALFKALTACCFANMDANQLSFPTSLRFLLPPSGSFPTLRFISVHGVHLHVHITMPRPPS